MPWDPSGLKITMTQVESPAIASDRPPRLGQRRHHRQRPGVVPRQRGGHKQHHDYHRPRDAGQHRTVIAPESPPQQRQRRRNDRGFDQSGHPQQGVEVDVDERGGQRVDHVRRRRRHGEPIDDLDRAGQRGQPSQADARHGGRHGEHHHEDHQTQRGGDQEGLHRPVPPSLTQMAHPHPDQKRQRDSSGGLDRDPERQHGDTLRRRGRRR